ncbi:BrnT family toxin [Candidatus Albibeggiatoa sp. nov. NOAA]|uniref:BrnT family toxin n=1 Tax=Candidatus Albibeggiatoa sp. nov. NOAA TaxID=3162724 RepID=UPI0032F40002|nr:BrnT family toxin [Thiotrichaceae bacterium]
MKLIFEWDENKACTNLKKHHVDFEEAKTVFSDPLLLTYPDDMHSEQEERAISIGYSKKHRLLLVVHTEQYIRNGVTIIRMISSRKATLQERKYYES